MTQIISQAELDALVQAVELSERRYVAVKAVCLSAEATWNSIIKHPSSAISSVGFVCFTPAVVLLDGDFRAEDLRVILSIQEQIEALRLPE